MSSPTVERSSSSPSRSPSLPPEESKQSEEKTTKIASSTFDAPIVKFTRHILYDPRIWGEIACWDPQVWVGFHEIRKFAFHKSEKVKIHTELNSMLNGKSICELFDYVADNGSATAFTALIASSRFSEIPAEHLGKAIWGAGHGGHGPVVNALIACPRFKEIPAEFLGKALVSASNNGHVDIVNALISCSRFNEIRLEPLEKARRIAVDRGHEDIANALLVVLRN